MFVYVVCFIYKKRVLNINEKSYVVLSFLFYRFSQHSLVNCQNFYPSVGMKTNSF